MGTQNIEPWVIGTDKKPTIYLYDNNGDDIDIADLQGYGIIVYNSAGTIIGKYGSNIAGYDDTTIYDVEDNHFTVALDKSINTVEGYVKGRIVAIWDDLDFTDSNFESATTLVTLYNSIQ
jgi:hypothetical protein